MEFGKVDKRLYDVTQYPFTGLIFNLSRHFRQELTICGLVKRLFNIAVEEFERLRKDIDVREYNKSYSAIIIWQEQIPALFQALLPQLEFSDRILSKRAIQEGYEDRKLERFQKIILPSDLGDSEPFKLVSPYLAVVTLMPVLIRPLELFLHELSKYNLKIRTIELSTMRNLLDSALLEHCIELGLRKDTAEAYRRFALANLYEYLFLLDPGDNGKWAREFCEKIDKEYQRKARKRK